jgi:hypothetical protein
MIRFELCSLYHQERNAGYLDWVSTWKWGGKMPALPGTELQSFSHYQALYWPG